MEKRFFFSEQLNKRLDLFLSEQTEEFTRSRLKKLIEEGKVTVTLGFAKHRDPLAEYLIGSSKAAIIRNAPAGTAVEVKTIIKNEAAPKKKPGLDLGFEEVAERIAKYPAVESVSLMSGACDLTVVVTGKTFQEVSLFVAKELAIIDSVTSTATQFIMRRYKEFGVELTNSEEDGRGTISL